MDRNRMEFIRGTVGARSTFWRLSQRGRTEMVSADASVDGLLRLELEGRRFGGRAERSLMDVMKLVGVGEDDAKVRVRWRHAIGCCDTAGNCKRRRRPIPSTCSL